MKVPEREEVDDAELDRRIEALYGPVKAERIFRRWKALRKVGNPAAEERERADGMARSSGVSAGEVYPSRRGI